MANPIIKIKRGSGEPPVWDGNPTNPTGITAGEFAFDRATGMLYLGVTGQYLLASNSNGYQGLCALNGPFVVPVGAQISDDGTFGVFVGDAFDNTLGFSSYTVPTTRAVRQFVLEQKSAAAFGFTLQAGSGIEFANPTDDVLRIDNIGALEAFTKTQLQAQGGIISGNSTSITPIGATAGILKYIARSGIAIENNVSTGTASLAFTNIGVTGINGFTGNITNFSTISSLAGSTAFVNDISTNTIVISANTTPISVGFDTLVYNAALGYTQAYYFFNHNTPEPSFFPVTDKVVGGYSNGYMYVPSITYDQWGHIKYSKGITLFADGIIPLGLTEAVQDIVGDSAFLRGGTGINIAYSDGNNTLTITNTGVATIKDGDGTTAAGQVTIQGTNGQYITTEINGNIVSIGQDIPYFKSIQISGENVPLSGNIDAAGRDDTLGVVSGKGIRLIPDQGNQRFTIENYGVTGINGFTGEVRIAAGTNVSISPNASTRTLTISAAGGGGGDIGSIDAEYLLDANTSSEGVTGFVKILGLSYGIGDLDDSGINYGKNIITFRSDSTTNGEIYLDLSPRLEIPLDVNNDSSVTIYPQAAYRQGPATIQTSTLGSAYADNGIYTPMIYAGMTGAELINSEGNPLGGDSYPGKELIIKAVGGGVAGAFGTLYESTYDAVIALSAYPTNNNFVRFLIDNGYLIGDCPEGGCVGFPPVIPGCNGTSETFIDSGGTTSVARGSATIVANTIIDGGLAVANDIFLTGNIYNSSGCKLDIGAASQASDYFDACGTLRNPGGIYLNGSTCDADSDRAIFNVSEFFIKDRLVTIGGASGNNDPTNTGQFGTTMDVGFLMRSYLNSQPRTAFIGIDTSVGTEGTFKFIPTASLTENASGRFVGGNVGPAEFSTINNFGISGGNSVNITNSSNGTVASTNRLVIRDLRGATADVSLRGTGHVTFGGSNFITLDSSASILMSQNNKFVSNMASGSIFNITSNLSGLTFDMSANSLQIKKRNSSSQVGTYTFPSITTDTSILVDTTSTQTLQAKTIGTNCVIDCGSY